MIRRAIAERLERGSSSSKLLGLAARAWHATANPVRPFVLPGSARVVAVGGATLGGSCKTPVVLELARRLRSDARVVVVASGYRARVTRVVCPSDSVDDVGDEALMLARALDSVPVVVSPRRRDAIAIASGLGEILILDGVLQAFPERVACSFLVLDRDRPWGAERCPPVGDLRASRERLLNACDAVLYPRSSIVGARKPNGELVRFAALRSRRLGVALAIARPARVLDALHDAGIAPAVVALGADHGLPPAPPRARAVGLDAWLVTAKCATKLGDYWQGAPVWVLEHRVVLPAAAFESALGRPLRRDDRPVVGSAPCSSGEPSVS